MRIATNHMPLLAGVLSTNPPSTQATIQQFRVTIGEQEFLVSLSEIAAPTDPQPSPSNVSGPAPSSATGPLANVYFRGCKAGGIISTCVGPSLGWLSQMDSRKIG